MRTRLQPERIQEEYEMLMKERGRAQDRLG